jgi:hypothetical protein
MDRAHTKRQTITNRKLFVSKPSAKNMRSQQTRRRHSATRRLKIYSKEVQAAHIARLVAVAAQNMGVVPEVVGGAGAAAVDPFLAELNLEQAVAILNQVTREATNPAPALTAIQNQTETVIRRGCRFQIRLKDLFFVLLTLANVYSLKFPILAPPREKTYFDAAAGYFALAGTVGSAFTLDTAATYSACGMGLQFVGGITRGIASATGKHPMTPNNIRREALKFVEYLPGPASTPLSYGKYAGLANLSARALSKHVETGNKLQLRGGIPAVKSKPETGVIANLMATTSNAPTAANIITKAAKSYGYSESNILKASLAATAGSLL